MSLHPNIRGVSLAFALIGALLASKPIVLLTGWFVLVLPLAIASGLLRRHLHSMLVTAFPLLVALMFVWGGLVRAAPGEPPGTSALHGFEFSASVVLRLVLLSGVLQVGLWTIPDGELLPALKSWGLRKDFMLIAAGAIALVPELQYRVQHVLEARLARGLMPDRKLMTRALQIPFLLRPIFTWVLRSAIQRAEYWQQRGILERAGDIPTMPYSGTSIKDVGCLLVTLLWLFTTIIIRIYYTA